MGFFCKICLKMTILTCKQTCECISLQIFSKYPIQKSWDRTNPPPPTSQLWKLTLPPGVGGRFEIFSLKWRERINLKVPGAILPLGSAILSTRAITVRGGWYNPPLGELGLKITETKNKYKNSNACQEILNWRGKLGLGECVRMFSLWQAK